MKISLTDAYAALSTEEQITMFDMYLRNMMFRILAEVETSEPEVKAASIELTKKKIAEMLASPVFHSLPTDKQEHISKLAQDLINLAEMEDEPEAE